MLYKDLTVRMLVVSLATSLGILMSPAQGWAAMEEIVVTATKRAELAQDVPLSLAALNADMLQRQRILDVRDVTNFVPAFEFTQSTTREFERPVIRGQSTVLSQTDTGVTTFIDGVAINGAISTLNLGAVERLEVVKGPQSALFGRNTYAGALNVILKRPSNEFASNLRLTGAEHDEYEIRADVSGPLIENKLAGGIYLRYYEYGGEFTNEFDGADVGDEESQSISAALSFTPTENLDIVARYAHGEDDDGVPAMFSTPDSILNFGLESGGDTVGEFFQGTLSNFPTNVDSEFQPNPGFRQDRDFASLIVEWDISDVWSFTSTSGWEDTSQEITYDADQLPASVFFPIVFFFTGTATVGGVLNFDDQETFQQEIRFQYDAGNRLRALIGAYYYDDEKESRRDGSFATPEIVASQQWTDQCAAAGALMCVPGNDRRNIIQKGTKNWSVFGKLSYDIAEKWNASIEARYQSEKVDYSFHEFAATPAPITGSETFDHVAPRFTVQYSPTPDNMIYLFAANGTKPGGVNARGGFDPLVNEPLFDEEEVWSFELGTKNTFMEGQVLLNLAGFYNAVTDYQQSESVPQSSGGPAASIRNNGELDVYGVELQSGFSPDAIPGFRINFAYAYLNPELGKGTTSGDQGTLDDIADNGLIDCSFAGSSDPRPRRCRPTATSVEGNRLSRTAEHQISALIDYRRPINDRFEWFVGANVAYNSAKYANLINVAEYGEATIVDLNAGISGDVWGLTIWGRNVSDEDSPSEITQFVNLQSFETTYFGNLRRGSQWGLTVTANF